MEKTKSLRIRVRPKKLDWYTSLMDLIDDHYMDKFDYGTFDCALWGADAYRVQLADNYDIAKRWRGKYTNLREGMAQLKKDGFVNYVQVFERELYEIPPAMAQSGDLVVVDGLGGMESVAVVVKNIIYVPTSTSLGILQFTDAKRAFAVGRNPNED